MQSSAHLLSSRRSWRRFLRRLLRPVLTPPDVARSAAIVTLTDSGGTTIRIPATWLKARSPRSEH